MRDPVVSVRIPAVLLRQLDRHARQLARERPELKVDRSTAVRIILADALRAIEAERAA